MGKVVFEADFERWVDFRQVKKEKCLLVKEKDPVSSYSHVL